MKELQNLAKEARSWSQLQLILVEAYDRRHISTYPSERFDFIEYRSAESKELYEFLYDPKVGLKQLKSRGWTEKLLAMFDEPLLAANPHGGYAQMRLWRISSVQEWEALQQVKHELNANLKRKHKRQQEKIAA